MIILRIEHKISNFEGWKKAFDSDPLNREKSGVKRYRIFQPTDDLNFVIIDLEFDKLDEAKATQMALQNMWKNIEGKLIFSPKITLLNTVESKDY
jgi:hypothetical protein